LIAVTIHTTNADARCLGCQNAEIINCNESKKQLFANVSSKFIDSVTSCWQAKSKAIDLVASCRQSKGMPFFCNLIKFADACLRLNNVQSTAFVCLCFSKLEAIRRLWMSAAQKTGLNLHR
jgi:hypothetical protein